ncbi:MAG: hypothetical protein ACXADB_13710, partial [Candidatus Hermodarchaeia archaeon]
MNHEDNVQPPHWDVSSVYPSLSSPEFLGDKDLLENTLESLNAYLDEKHIRQKPDGPVERDPAKLAETLGHIVGQLNSLMELTWTLRAYINAFTSTDSYNAEAKKAFSNWEKTYVRLQRASTRVRGWIGTLG